MPKATRVVPVSKVEAGKRSAAGRARDEKGRLLPRNPTPPAGDPGSPPAADPAPPAPDGPAFTELRRRWSPIYGRRRRKATGE